MDANLDYPKHLNYSDFEPKQFLEFLLENPEDLTTITSLSPVIFCVIDQIFSLGKEYKVCNVLRLLAQVVLHFPHTKGKVTKLLSSLNVSNILNFEDIKANTTESISLNLKAVNILLTSECLLDIKKINIDTLLSLFLSGNNQIKFYASSLICSVFGFTHTFRNKFLESFNVDTQKHFWDEVSCDSKIFCKFRYNELIELDEVKVEMFETSPHIENCVRICQRVLPKMCSDKAINLESNSIIDCSTTRTNLSKLSEAILMNNPIIIQGHAGTGKSFLIRELANIVGLNSNIFELHLDDKTDFKTMVGSFICSDIPGDFVWVPGILTCAVMRGSWLVLENIERIPLDIIASLVYLFEHKSLPSYLIGKTKDLPCHPSFRLIGTHTSLIHRNDEIISMRHFLSYFQIVKFNPFTTNEVVSIMQDKFPKNSSLLCSNLLSLYESYISRNYSHKSRHVSTRDLFKVASRINNITDFNQSQSSNHFHLSEYLKVSACLECIDIFCSSIRDAKEFIIEARNIGSIWGLTAEIVDIEIVNRKIQIHRDNLCVSIGRISFSDSNSSYFVNSQENISTQNVSIFAFTDSSQRLIEKIAASIFSDEVVLLVGETGCGKTTVIQRLASLLGKKLLVQNLSLFSDVTDIIGGYKPVTIQELIRPTYNNFLDLFAATFSKSQNEPFLNGLSICFKKKFWKKLLEGFLHSTSNAINKSVSDELKGKWIDFKQTTERLLFNLPNLEKGFAFMFKEGLLVQALLNGDWILLDEINLSSSETLQSLLGILDGKSIILTEKGDMKLAKRHPNFRLFAAMNPPTDIGKKELPESIRNRFTEIYVSEIRDRLELSTIVKSFLCEIQDNFIFDIVDTYLACIDFSSTKLVDSAGIKPHFSLRSLVRALQATKIFLSLNIKPFNRAVFEGFSLSFIYLLNEPSQKFLTNFIAQNLTPSGAPKFETDFLNLSKPPSKPKELKDLEYILIKPFWVRKGPNQIIDWEATDDRGITRFVLTDSVKSYLRSIVSAVAVNIAPILLQGPTSVGKTTIIEYLAAKTGHKCIRINNHDHTDVQEYIGGYITNNSGHLEFKDGLLVEALRKGYWVILDELNLAPSDVLEALNRLLDDNRELLIPETGEIVKPSPGFFLFATQNPPGIYGGRKPLSRAFRNRFFEISINDLEPSQMETIVSKSCGIPPRFSTYLVKTMQDLQRRRQNSVLLQGKHGVVTMRDLIKWGKRSPQNPSEIVKFGYMLLAEKLRSEEEKLAVQNTLQDICNVKLSINDIYDQNSQIILDDKDYEAFQTLQVNLRSKKLTINGVSGIACTSTMFRMWKLLSHAFKSKEPVLFIGETGTGKTTVCQMYAAQHGQHIKILNCHQSTETADIIGGLRPIRNREGILKNIENDIKDLYLNLMIKFVSIKDKIEQDLSSFFLKSLNSNYSYSHEELTSAFDILLKAYDDNITGSSPVKKLKMSEGQSSIEEDCKSIKESFVKYSSMFEWFDGPLVTSMKEGHIFVLDEINLAEDAIIERLNSVLESNREITLAEKGGYDSEKIVAHPNFRLVATMNPSGDFGKRELSPALRSRFTEIWVASKITRENIAPILVELLDKLHDFIDPNIIANQIVDFIENINANLFSNYDRFNQNAIKITIRDIINWANFINGWFENYQESCSNRNSNLGSTVENSALYYIYFSIVHAAEMIFLDGIGNLSIFSSSVDIQNFKNRFLFELLNMCPAELRNCIQASLFQNTLNNNLILNPSNIMFGAFKIERFIISDDKVVNNEFVLTSNNSKINFGRLLRAMQLTRPILLEGPPGVGKSSMVSALASLSGVKLVRINLSEHSELSDLLGSDLPVAQAQDNTHPNDSSDSLGAKFSWSDGLFLKAMKAGHWVLLDELNLAPQSVLEGLNSCFDHRERIFIPEIGISVERPNSFRIFCTQNPMNEGGGRKGLPQSFLSRLTRVYIEPLTEYDLLEITQKSFTNIPVEDFVPSLINLTNEVKDLIFKKGSFAQIGAPWEFNLRDLKKLCDFLSYYLKECLLDCSNLPMHQNETFKKLLSESFYLIYVARMRTSEDRFVMCSLFNKYFGESLDKIDMDPLIKYHNEDFVSVGLPCLAISNSVNMSRSSPKRLLGPLNKVLENISTCVLFGWPVLLCGASGVGKRHVVNHLAQIAGHRVVEYFCSAATDTTELLGSFEQFDLSKDIDYIIRSFEVCIASLVETLLVFNKSHSLYNKYTSSVFDSILSFQNTSKIVEEKTANLTKSSSSYDIIFNHFENLMKFIWLSQDILNQVEYDDQHKENFKFQRKQYDSTKAYIENLKNKITLGSNFRWMDGVVTQALIDGTWLILNNVNLCSSSILDRLNSILEPNGELVLSESGYDRVIKPHNDFRLFLVMDPSCGELSRAMRNRCVEIALIDFSEEYSFLIEIINSGLNIWNQDSAFNDFHKVYTTYMGNSSGSVYSKNRYFRRFLSQFKLLVSFGYSYNTSIKQASWDTLRIEYLIHNDTENLISQSNDKINSLFKSFDSGLIISDNLFCAINSFMINQSGDNDASSSLSSSSSSLSSFPPGWLKLLSTGSLKRYTSIKKMIGHSGLDLSSFIPQDFKIYSDALGFPPWDRENLQSFSQLIHSSINSYNFSFEFFKIMNFENIVDRLNSFIEEVSTSDIFDVIFKLLKSYDCNFDNNVFKNLFKSISSGMYTSDPSCKLLYNAKFLKSIMNDCNPILISKLYDNLDSWYKSIDILVLRRLKVLILEHTLIKSVNNMTNVTSYLNFESSFSVAFAISIGLLSADNKHLKVIHSIYNLIKVIDNFLTSLSMNLLFSFSNNGGLMIEFNTLISENLRYRDILIMLIIKDIPKNQQISWDHIIIAFFWLEKSYKCIKNKLNENSEFFQSEKEFLGLLGNVNVAIDLFKNQLGSYFENPIFIKQSTLWQVGGHSAIITKINDWDILESIKNSYHSLCIPSTSYLLDNFEGPTNDVIFKICGNRFLIKEWLRDWLAFYSTFYWNAVKRKFISEDITEETSTVNTLNTRDIVSLLAEKFPRDLLIYNHDRQDLQGSIRLIETEYILSGISNNFIVSESIIIKVMYEILEKLAQLIIIFEIEINSFDLPSNLSDLSLNLSHLINYVINKSLSSSLFEPISLYEYQLFVWTLENLLSDIYRTKTKSEQCFSPTLIYSKVFKSIYHMLQYRLYIIEVKSISSNFLFYSIEWGSPTLNSLFDYNNRVLPTMDVAESKLVDTYSITTKRFQPVSFIVISNYFSILNDNIEFSVFLYKDLDSNTKKLNISSIHTASKRVQEVYNLILNVSENNYFSRLNLLKITLFDIFESCLIFFPSVDKEDFLMNLKLKYYKSTFPSPEISRIFIEIYDIISNSIEFTTLDAKISNILTSCFFPLLIKSSEFSNSHNLYPFPNLDTISFLWVIAGVTRLHLLVPRLPIDPALKSTIKSDLITSEINDLKENLLFKHLISVFENGCAISSDSNKLLSNIDHLFYLNNKLEKKIINRPSSARRFVELFTELNQSISSFLSIERISSLVNYSFDNEKSDLQTKIKEEDLFQSNLCLFVDSLKLRYSEYDDILSPIYSSLQNISSGMRIIYSNILYKKNYLVSGYANLLSSIYKISTFSISFREEITPKMELLNHLDQFTNYSLISNLAGKNSILVYMLAVVNIDAYISINSVIPNDVYSYFESIVAKMFQDHLLLKEQEKKLSEDRNKYFHQKVDDFLTEEDEENQYLEEIFPDYLENLSYHTKPLNNDIDETNDLYQENQDKKKSINSSNDLNDKMIGRLLSYYAKMIFFNFSSFLNNKNMSMHKVKNVSNLNIERYKMLIEKQISISNLVSQLFANPMKEIVDPFIEFKLKEGNLLGLSYLLNNILKISSSPVNNEKSFDISNLFDNINEESYRNINGDLLFIFENYSLTPWNAPNFYHDPDPKEVCKISLLINKLISKTIHLLSKYPENEILHNICKISTVISNYDLSTSLAKMLSSIQFLLRKIQEWEEFASSELSLKAEIKDLSAFVISWRTKELSSWKELIRAKEQSFSLKSMSYFPQMANIIILICNQSIENADIDLKNIYESFDLFLSNCNIGEFATRLHIVRLLSLQVMQKTYFISSSVEKNTPLVLLSNILYGIWRFYEQFLTPVESFKTSHKQPIQQKIIDEVKISKWDKFSTYTLIANSDSIHRKLTKLIKQYETDCLVLPVSVIFLKCLHGFLASEDGSSQRITEIPDSKLLYPFLDKDSSYSESYWEDKLLTIFDTATASKATTQAVDYSHFLSTNPLEVELITRLPSLCGKTNKYLKKSLTLNESEDEKYLGKYRFGNFLSLISEDLFSDILSRIDSLRNKSTKSMKHLALKDLFKELKFHGFSHLKSDFPEKYRSNLFVFETINPFSLEISQDLTFTSSNPSNSLERGDIYFYRVLTELNQLRQQINSKSSEDIAINEVNLMVNFSESLFYALIKIREVIATNSSNFKHFSNILLQIDKLSSSNRNNLSSKDDSIFDYIKKSGGVLLNNLLIFSNLVENSLAESNLKDKNNLTELLSNVIKKFSEKVVYSFEINSDIENNISFKLFDEFVFSCFNYNGLDNTNILKDLDQIESSLQTCCNNFSSVVPRDLVDSILYQFKTFTNTVISKSTTVKSDVEINLNSFAANTALDDLLKDIHNLTKMSLVAIQNVESQGIKDTSEESCSISNLFQKVSESYSYINIDKCIGSLIKLEGNLKSFLSDNLDNMFRQSVVLHFTRDFIELYKFHVVILQTLLEDSSLAYKSMGKLAYTILRTFRTLLAKGYCSSSHEENENDDGNNENLNFDDTDGTGMADGLGKKDVSDEIENEEQLLGNKSSGKEKDENEVKDNDPERPKLNQKDAESGVEMSMDFDGDIYDLENTPENSVSEDEKSDVDDTNEIDREMGEIEDNNIIDKKMWDEEDEQEDLQEKPNGDEKTTGQPIEDLKSKSNDDEDESQDNDKENQKSLDECNSLKNHDNEDFDEKNHDDADDDKCKLDSNQDPEEDGDNTNSNNNNNDESKFEDNENTENNEEDGNDDNNSKGSNEIENQKDNAIENLEMDIDNIETANDQNDESQQDNGSESDMDDPINEDSKKLPDVEPNKEEEEEDEKNNPNYDNHINNLPDNTDERRPPTFGVQSVDGLDNIESQIDIEQQKDVSSQSFDESTNKTNSTGLSNNNKSSKSDGSNDEISNQNNSDTASNSTLKFNDHPNPIRTPGDLNEFWHRRLNMNNNFDSDKSSSQETTSNQNNQFEYSNSKKSSQQVLAESLEADILPTDSNELDDVKSKNFEHQKIQETKNIDKDNENAFNISNENENENENMTIDNNKDKYDDKKFPDDIKDESFDHDDPVNDTEGNDILNDVNANFILSGLQLINSTDRDDTLDLSALNNEEVQLKKMIFDSFNEEEMIASRILWNQYKNKTDIFSTQLCEQLRLILEPTLATQLQGDFKTGKRINMRKIIGYIASGFRKDKIWLRRTKPAKRNYQVMLMIDNSSSMGESGPLALSALALISSALNRLEVGEISVASFAEKLSILHPFGEPLTDDVGAYLLTKFKFEAIQTKLANCLNSLIHYFDSNTLKSSLQNSNTNQMQICFIISDARVDADNRESLSNLISQFADRHIICVLLIIDKNKILKDSILETKIIEFTESGIISRAYLDNFPFPYFAVIQNLEMLPNILSETLKQWFETIKLYFSN